MHERNFCDMSKRIEVEVPDEIHQKIKNRCEKVGCDVNEYMSASVEYALDGVSFFDFGQDEK